MAGLSAHFAHRHLGGVPVVLFPLAVISFGQVHPFGVRSDNHRPDWALGEAVAPRVV